MKVRMESANVVRKLRVRARNILNNYVAKVSTQICMIMNNINIQENNLNKYSSLHKFF